MTPPPSDHHTQPPVFLSSSPPVKPILPPPCRAFRLRRWAPLLALSCALLQVSPAPATAAEASHAWARDVLDEFRARGADTGGLLRPLTAVHRTCTPAQAKFFAALLPEAMELMQSKNIPLAATAAMAAYESGYGRSALARDYHNYFGIKAFADWFGPRARNMPTRDNGVRTRADFRSYGSLSESTRNFGHFLTTKKHYARALEVETGPEFVARVLAGGYCPDRDYHANAVAIMRRHQLLELERACRQAFAVSDFPEHGW